MCLEGEINVTEAASTLHKLKNKLSSFWLFYRVFQILFEGFKIFYCGLHTGELSVAQTQGIIIFLPKNSNSRHFMKN